MPKDITLETVDRKEVGPSQSKKIFVRARGTDGNLHEMSAFQEAWNDGWRAGDTVSVVIKSRESNGKTYLNLYPSASEANTARPTAAPQEPRTMSDTDAIRTLSLSLHAKLEQEFARINLKLDALGAEKELNDLTGDAIAKGF